MSKRQKSPHKNTPPARSATSVPGRLNLRVLTGVAVIVLAAFCAYLPSLNGGFILDDDKLLTDNRLIKAADGLYRFCTTEAIDFWPVSNTTLWIEWRLWGMNSTGYHVTNLILHIVNALLIWVILWKLSIPGAFWAAMIFAVHPVNVESVAWISQRKGLLAMLFFLLSILWYLRQFLSSSSDNAQRSRHTPCAATAHGVCGQLIGPWYWLSLLAFLLALLSKGSVAVLPVLLLVIVWWRREVTRRDLVRTAPFFLVAAVLAIVNVWFQTHGQDVVTRQATFIERLLGAGGVVWFYLYKALLPLNLIFIYPQWHIHVGNVLWWLPVVAAVTLTVVLWQYRQGWSRPFLFAWGFFCVSLLPVLGFADVGFMQYSLISDHYQYTGIIGVIALVAAGYDVWHKRAPGPVRSTASTVPIVVLGLLTFLTWQQSGLYSNAMTLYQATLEKNPACWIAHNNLGNVLDEAGRGPEAMEHYRQALRLNEDYADAHNNLGVSLDKIGKLPEAVEHYQKALRLNPTYAEAHNNLGYALVQMDQLPEAIEHLQQAQRLKPDYADAQNNLGLYFIKTGRPQEAIEHFQQALKLKSNFPEAYNNYGNALVHLGRLPEAIEQYQQALKLISNYPEAYNNLGFALCRAGRPQEAITSLMHAIELKPDYINGYYNLAVSYAQANRSAEALAAAQKALQLARSQNQTGLAKQLEDWLNSYHPQNTVK